MHEGLDSAIANSYRMSPSKRRTQSKHGPEGWASFSNHRPSTPLAMMHSCPSDPSFEVLCSPKVQPGESCPAIPSSADRPFCVGPLLDGNAGLASAHFAILAQRGTSTLQKQIEKARAELRTGRTSSGRSRAAQGDERKILQLSVIDWRFDVPMLAFLMTLLLACCAGCSKYMCLLC